MKLAFPCESRVPILSDMPETCQHFFKVFPKFYSRTGLCRAATYAESVRPASKILRDAAPLAAEAGNPEANYL